MALDPLGLEADNDPLGLGLDEPKEEKSYAQRVLTEGLPAVANFAIDIPNAAVAGLMGAGEAVGGLVRGKGLDPSINRGVETFGRAMESMREPGRPGIPRFHGRAVEEAGGALMGALEKGVGYIGDITGDPAPFAMGFQTPPEAESPAGRTIGEAASNFAPVLPGIRARGVRPQEGIPQPGIRSRGERQATEAQAILDEKVKADKLEKDLIDLDNLMINYGKDLQAPQLGLGGKVAKHEDQIGREKGEFRSQMAFDEEMRAQAEAQQGQRPLQVPSVLEAYEPTYEGRTGEHAPFPVRPYQIEQQRPGRISEGEATQIYRTPPFNRTLEQKMKLEEYEKSLRGPDIEGVQGEEPFLGGYSSNRYKEPLYAVGVRNHEGKLSEVTIRADSLEKAISKIKNIGYDITGEARQVEFISESQYIDVKKELGGRARRSQVHGDTETYWYREDWLRGAEVTDPEILARARTLDEMTLEMNRASRAGEAPDPKKLSFTMEDYIEAEYQFKKMVDDKVGPLHGRNVEPWDYNDSVRKMQESSASTRDMLEDISRNSKIPYYKELARVLLLDKTYNPRFEIQTKETGFQGHYYPTRYTIGINLRGIGQEGLFLHENIHARTHGAIETALRAPERDPKLVPAVNRLRDLYIGFRDHYETLPVSQGPNRRAQPYGLTNIHEFIAEGFTNPDFQMLLGRTSLPKNLQTNMLKTYWDKFVDGIRKLLGIKDSTANTYLSEVIRTGGEIMRLADSNTRRSFEGPMNFDEDFRPQWPIGGYSLKEFKTDLKARGINIPDEAMKAMYEQSKLAEAKPKQVEGHPSQAALAQATKIDGLERIQQIYRDERPWEEVLPIIQKARDMGMVSKNVVAKILNGKFTAEDHPLLGWISSQISMLKGESVEKSMSRLHGKSRKQPDPGTYNYIWKQLTGKEREAVNDFGWKHNNSDKPVTPADLAQLSPKQRQAYQDRININKQVWADVNAQLKAEGKPIIPPLPNYWSPIILDGPFIVKFKDAKGETRKIADFYMQPNMKKMNEIAREQNMTAELQPERGIRGEMDFEQFDWILRQLSKEQRDSAAKAISEGLRRQGFGRHGMKRKGVEGGAGSEGGRKGLRNYEETSEKYIRRAYEWISNRKLDKLYNQVLDEKSIDGQPYAKSLALESIDTARGGSNATFEAFSNALGRIVSGTIQVGTLGAVKLPNRFARDLLRHSNKVKTGLLLAMGNVGHIAANGLQAWSYAPPAMMSLAGKAGLNTAQMAVAVPKAMIKSTLEMAKWDKSKDIKKLQELGTLDPTFKYDWSTYASDADPRYSSTVGEHLTGISTLMWIEENAVRRPASLMFLNMLREIGYEKIAKNKDEIYHVAKEMTDKYMVSNRWYDKPHAFSRSGIVGTAVSPLQSFTTTWLGMLREYAALSKEGLLEPSLAKQLPLASFMAVNVLTSGMLGLIGIKEWDYVATFLNKHFGYNIPTGTEWVMSKFKDTKYRFGLLSDAVGVHIGATFNAPTLTGSFAPGMQFMGDVGNFAAKMGQQGMASFGVGTPPTSVEMREAWKGVTPRFNWMDRATEAAGLGQTGLNWGAVERKYTPEGAPYQDMAGNAGPVERTPEDWRARDWGQYTIKEAEEKTLYNIDKLDAAQRKSRMSSQIEKMADTIMMNPDDPDIMSKLEPMIARLEEDKVTGAQIRKALRRELMAKSVKATDRNKAAIIARILRELPE